MASRRKTEKIARLLVLGLIGGLLLAVALARWMKSASAVEVHARMPERGGWSPDNLSTRVGQPLRLRLTSDDVVHGFAIGQRDWPAVDLYPGKVVEVTLVFDNPGTYTYYCTRWCGPNHWRMRGTIEVSGEVQEESSAQPPLYVQLGLDIDAPHRAQQIPARRPSAKDGANLDIPLPATYLSLDYYRSHTPEVTWQDLRACRYWDKACPARALSDEDLWNLVALIWQSNLTPQQVQQGRDLYTANCAACHGETGKGDGVFAASVEGLGAHDKGNLNQPTDFTDRTAMFSASPAHLQGKILRGGMGTGMPYWGPIFTEDQTWALVAYLWTFTFDFDLEVQP